MPRHRRKAGSGPPANALIAWISADPYLREAAATVSYQREIALPPSSHTRSVKAATVVCFALACSAVLGITTIISHGRSATQFEIATMPLRPDRTPTPDLQSSPIYPTQAGSDPVLSPVPVDMAPMLAEGATPHPITVPSTDRQIDQIPDDQPEDDVQSGAITGSIPSGSSRRIGKPSNPDKPMDPGKAGHAKETFANGTSSDNDKHAGPDKPADPSTPSRPGTSDQPGGKSD